MKRKTVRLIIAGTVFGSFVAIACQGKSAHTPTVSGGQPAAPATQTVSDKLDSYTDPNSGVSVNYPKSWTPKPSDDYELLITPRNASDAMPSISVDVPDLPAHIPGMIPLGSVKNGYIKDLKKKQPDLKIVEESSPKIEKSKADLVRTTWTDKQGHSLSETALLIVHGDGVYIIRADSDDAHYKATRSVFDSVTSSLKWTK